MTTMGEEADASKPEDHHRPCGGFGDGRHSRRAFYTNRKGTSVIIEDVVVQAKK